MTDTNVGNTDGRLNKIHEKIYNYLYVICRISLLQMRRKNAEK